MYPKCFRLQTATLEVVIPPDIINEETSGDMMVPEGGSAKLVCRARGHPKPKITWRREDGREIIARNGSHQKTKGKCNASYSRTCKTELLHLKIKNLYASCLINNTNI